MLFLVTDEKVRNGKADGEKESSQKNRSYGERGTCGKSPIARHHIRAEEHGNDRTDGKSHDHKERRFLMLFEDVRQKS